MTIHKLLKKYDHKISDPKMKNDSEKADFGVNNLVEDGICRQKYDAGVPGEAREGGTNADESGQKRSEADEGGIKRAIKDGRDELAAVMAGMDIFPEYCADSAHALRLLSYLDRHRDLGIRLVASEGCPALRFDPGLNVSAMGTDRWGVAMAAVDLLHDAAPDLISIIRG